jgi:AcrR family transcriptional regulator
MTLYRNFASKDDLILAFLERREERWTRGWLQKTVEGRAATPAQRLLAIFDVFGEWFAREDFEGCSFINVMLELDDPGSPVRRESVRQLSEIRGFIGGLAREAGVREADAFARQWHILMKGCIVAAAEGDRQAAARARELGGLLLSHHGIEIH